MAEWVDINPPFASAFGGFDKFRIKLVEAAEGTGEWWVYIDPFGQEREIRDVEELD